MGKILIYANGDAENHGCEAITQATLKILGLDKINSCVATPNLEKDKEYGVDLLTNLVQTDYSVKYNIFKKVINKMTMVCLNRRICAPSHKNKNLEQEFKKADIALSAGGDNYCYEYIDWLKPLNKYGVKNETKLVLWGCSIEESVLQNKEHIKDLQRYNLIVTRESITYNSLINSKAFSNVKLLPDPAFALEKVELSLPKGFELNNTIGINVSPMIIQYEKTNDTTINNFKKLISYIIDNTTFQIALIPHVVWKHTDDRKPLLELFNEFKHTGRVVMVDDSNCMELKGYISRLRMFIGARTHATIAAYSTCVPTLVIGYSVKARGIAKDIFGKYENYVLPVQSLEKDDDLINAFDWMMENEGKIRKHLESFMPSYIKKAYQAGDEVKKIMGDI